MAAEKAEEFAIIAFVQRDISAAYALLSPDFKRRMSQQDMQETLGGFHAQGWPSSVTATDFGPMPGQPAMSIFIRGVSGDGNIYYRLIMQGTSDEGYKVAGFMQGQGEYPQAMRTPLRRADTGAGGE